MKYYWDNAEDAKMTLALVPDLNPEVKETLEDITTLDGNQERNPEWALYESICQSFDRAASIARQKGTSEQQAWARSYERAIKAGG